MTSAPLQNISFEFFPPKTPLAMQRLLDEAAQLVKLAPAFFSVTFGAGGSTREGTYVVAQALQEKTAVPVAPHLSCIGFEREELVALIQFYKKMGVKRILALRGDLPSGMVAMGAYRFASDFVQLIREVSGQHFHIQVAAYPECHPQAKNMFDDVLNLKKKYDAGANGAITQYFFNPDAYFYLLDDCAKQKIFMPIVPGIMPITQFDKLINFSMQCGAEVPRWLCKRLESYKDDPESVKALGIEVVYRLCQKLLQGGAPGLHFYTLNQARTSMEVLKQLRMVESISAL